MSMDVTDATFERDVVQRSAEVPVVVDLWAEWCGPCRQLGPILERTVAETGGRVALAKVNVDTSPRVSATFQVQSIPAVYALKDGRVVDSFIGALPEPQVREFIQSLAPAESEADRLVSGGDEESLRLALDLDPAHEGAVVKLAELLAERGESEEALALLARVPETADVRRVAALARVGAGANGDGDVEGRLRHLLDRVKDDADARQEFVDLLELLGPDDPRTPRYRRDLASRLY
ncbi:MAG: tetratricopeptide repeat protein [Actinobacteria bacterium]|nr:tetratricopeptide repeat protein [Actinomycetota bacterium]